MKICICITESLCCTPEMNTTLEINCTPIKVKLKKRKNYFRVMRTVRIYFPNNFHV